MGERKNYDSAYKLKVVLESMQRDTTIEKVRIKYGLSTSVINRWRKQFRENGHLIFEMKSKRRRKKVKESESPEYLKKIIGELTVENEILKKALSVWD